VPVLALLLPSARHAPVVALSVLVALSVGGLRVLPETRASSSPTQSPLLLLWGVWLALVFLEKNGHLADAP